MMLSRTALRSRHYIVVAGGLATAAAAVTGTSCYNNTQQRLKIAHNEHSFPSSSSSSSDGDNEMQQQQQQQHHQNSVSSFLPSSATDLIVPTLEAAARAGRLVTTAVLVTMDYKTYEWGWNTPVQYPNDNNENSVLSEEQRKLRDSWEMECDRRKEALEVAQEQYASKYHDNFDLADTLTLQSKKEERAERKRHDKQVMHLAAVALAEAEEQFASLGGVHRQSALHRQGAQRLVSLCHKNGGVYIKIGQHLANLDHLIPSEYIAALSTLFDENPVTPYDRVARVIGQDLGVQHPDDLFDAFCPHPIASASLAQVHVAYDKKTGKKLAVKVQHEGLRETSVGDIFAVVTVVRILERLFPKQFTYGWIADEIVPNLPKELDFLNEGRNAERAAANLKKWTRHIDCVVPKVHWQHSSPRVLTMAFEEGFHATNVQAMKEAGLDRKDVAKLISSVFSSQIFAGIGDPDSGWVHCDPHPANVLIRPKAGKRNKPEVVLVDHGLYRHLEEDFRIHYAHLWKALMLADINGIQESCRKLGVDEMYHLFSSMLTARPFEEIIERSQRGGSLRYQDPESATTTNNVQNTSAAIRSDQEHRADAAVIRGYAQRYLNLIIDLVVTLPRPMLLLLKMNDCLRHIDHALGSPTNTVVVCGSFAARAVYEAEIQQHSTFSVSSFVHRWRAWFSYMQVWLKVQIHDLGFWWLIFQKTDIRLTA
jgi:aarF domain-containing kinase